MVNQKTPIQININNLKTKVRIQFYISNKIQTFMMVLDPETFPTLDLDCLKIQTLCNYIEKNMMVY